jgi:hypothetical protein
LCRAGCRDGDGNAGHRPANHLATDGPYFPAPLVAVGFVALPIGVLLLLIQATVVAYEATTGRSLGHGLWAVGVADGFAAGLVSYLVMASSRTHAWMLWTLVGLGVCQGLVEFGCHWLAAGRKAPGAHKPRGHSAATSA